MVNVLAVRGSRFAALGVAAPLAALGLSMGLAAARAQQPVELPLAEVEKAGWTGLGGVRPGDLIQRIGEFDIDSLAGYRTAIEAITKAQPERIVFVVLRGVRTHFQYVEPD